MSEIDQIKAYRDKHGCTFKEATRAVRSLALPKEVKIGNDLIEAYKGVYEDEAIEPWTRAEKGYTLMGPDEAILKWVTNMINEHTPKERLDVYLQWNGILGYTNRIWELSQGEL